MLCCYDDIKQYHTVCFVDAMAIIIVIASCVVAAVIVIVVLLVFYRHKLRKKRYG